MNTNMQTEVKPLTYEQEVHALLWAGLSSTRDLVLMMEAQDQFLSPKERRINKKAVKHLRETTRRLELVIPKALERRDAVDEAKDRVLEVLKQWELDTGGRASAPEGNAFMDGYRMGVDALAAQSSSLVTKEEINE